MYIVRARVNVYIRDGTKDVFHNRQSKIAIENFVRVLIEVLQNLKNQCVNDTFCGEW